MSQLHAQYLKEDHFEDEQQEEAVNPSQKMFARETDREEVDDVEGTIMEQVLKIERSEDTISQDLQTKLQVLLQGASNVQNDEEMVRLRMSELALNKILVYTHGKSQFRLVLAHHHMGQAYLSYKCYEQAIDHLTLALKKNSKLSEIKETKLYHAFLLVSLSKCYFEINSYEDSLEVLKRAEEIQHASFKEMDIGNQTDLDTVKLIARCYLKMKNYQKAREYISHGKDYAEQVHGRRSIQMARMETEASRIYAEEKRYEEAISELDSAIEVLIENGFKDKLHLVELEESLAVLYEKNSDAAKQIETLMAKLQLLEQLYDGDHKSVLKLKRTIASVLIKNGRTKEAVAVLEEILESEERVYGQGSLHVGKTLKMLGEVFMKQEEINSAEHYFKRSVKILQEQGNTKLVKEVRGKVTALREMREKKVNAGKEQK